MYTFASSSAVIGKAFKNFIFARVLFGSRVVQPNFARFSNLAKLVDFEYLAYICRSVDTEVLTIVQSRTNLVISSFKNTLENSGGSVITINSNRIIYRRILRRNTHRSAQLLVHHVTSQKPRAQPLYVASLI